MGIVVSHNPSGVRTMKAVKYIVAIVITAILSGCVVYPAGYGGGYYGRPHHGGGHHHR
jgi:hypothetical protein